MKHRVGRVAVVFTLLACSVVSGTSPASAAAGRALILYMPHAPGASTDQANLKKALTESGWTVLSTPVGRGDAAAGVQALMDRFFNTPAGNTEPKLLYYSGHGGYVVDDGDPVDVPPTGEPSGSDWDESFFLRDDNLPTLSSYSGPVVGIFDSCYSGGVFDGSDDTSQGNAYLFSSAGRNEEISGDNALGSAFTVFVIRALMPGAADVTPNDGMITPDELHDYIVANWAPSWDWSGGTPDFLESTVWKDQQFFPELLATFVPPPTMPPAGGGGKCENEELATGVPATSSPWFLALASMLLVGGGLVLRLRSSGWLRPR